MYYGEGIKMKGMMLTHVDDLLRGTGDKEFEENVLKPLKERFFFGTEEDQDFNYVGMHVSQEGSTIITDQDHYVDTLEMPDWKPGKGSELDELLDDETQGEFRTLVGRIGWVSKSSRPNLAYDNLVLSLKVGKASQRDMKLAVKIKM